MLYILEHLIFPDFPLLNYLKHLNFLLKLKALIYYSIVRLEGCESHLSGSSLCCNCSCTIKSDINEKRY